MTDPKDFEEPEEGREVGGQGSDANASGPGPVPEPVEGSDDAQDAEELTVDDILNIAQNDDALAEDAVEDAALHDAEHTLLVDLKRLQAEYANYRRRTEEQRGVEIQRAKGEAAKGLLPVLDDLDRAAAHGDLEEGSPFAAIADKVRSVVERLGVVSYGEKGDEFDPQQHEAIFQQPTPGVEKVVVLEVVEVGYRLGDVELRPAKVVVAVPADPSAGSGTA